MWENAADEGIENLAELRIENVAEKSRVAVWLVVAVHDEANVG